MVNNTHQQAMDQRWLKTLIIWLIWALACAALLGALFQQPGVREFLLHESTRISWLIFAAFLFAVAVSFFHAIILSMEWKRALRLEQLICQHGITGLRPLKRQRRRVDQFIGGIQAVLQRNGQLELESLAAIEFSPLHRMSHMVSVIGNMLITLGLIGTVLGMTMIMSGLNGAVIALGENQQLLIEGIGNAMSGMGVAFYTTLMGAVFGGILLRLFSWITDNSVDALQELMLRTTLIYSSADLHPAANRELHILEADMARMQERVDLMGMACEATGREVGALVTHMMQLQTVARELGESDSIHRVAVQHARYAVGVRRARFWFWTPKESSGS